MSPTARCLKLLREEGWTCGVVEQVVPKSFIKRDFLGIIDLIAVRGPFVPGTNGSTMGVQVTATGCMSARIAKARTEPRLRVWLEAGNLFAVIGWAKRGKKGVRKLWTERRVLLTLKDLADVPPDAS